MERRLNELKNKQLKPRKYRNSLIDAVFEQIKKIDRKDAIKKKTNESFIMQEKRGHDKVEDIKCDYCDHISKDLSHLKVHITMMHKDKVWKKSKNDGRVIAPLTFDPRIGNHGKILHRHHTAMITKNEKLRKVFPKAPMAALRQTPNLRNLICKAKLFDVQGNGNDMSNEDSKGQGWKNCHQAGKKKPCRICPYTYEEASKIESTGNNVTHNIKGDLSCQTENGIYY